MVKRLMLFLGLGLMGVGAQVTSVEKAETTPVVVQDCPSVAEVEEALKKAAMFCRTNLSFAGGYATDWSRDLKESGTSDIMMSTVISIESPGTPSFGLAYLAGWKATGDPLYLQGMKEVVQALLWSQLASGGWDTFHDFALPAARKWHYRRDLDAGDVERGGRKARSTLDDGKTQLALMFLLEVAQLAEFKEDGSLQKALRFGMEGLLAAQAPNGGWPQGYEGPADGSAPVVKARFPVEWSRVFPKVEYTSFYTLNDGNLESLCRLLLRAHELDAEGGEKYLAAAKRLGDFLLLAQCPQPQPGWAQQYNLEMEPVWARKFEPPSVSSLETLGALKTLHQVWLATGEKKYLEPVKEALAWLEKSRLPDGQYARFYELGSNKPLYFVKDTYELTYEDGNLPTHYGFKLDELQDDIEQFKKLMLRPREELLAKRVPKATEREWLSALKGLTKKAVTALKDKNKEGLWTEENRYDAGEIVANMMVMAKYVEAAKGAGSLFEEYRGKVNVSGGG
ncbi:pectic acid lyase [Phragmitibacter flavus]|uniref:Pectic acid lyase n=1 Tax=Phragmitibacter flavus TaxID=2576071 RepID=A0A5R8KKY6_9BACT|nr:pectate lyase [Phragmitibacter flavus]TLD72319.1 pectic acid lyase [Phragmitibacter flavus]